MNRAERTNRVLEEKSRFTSRERSLGQPRPKFNSLGLCDGRNGREARGRRRRSTRALPTTPSKASSPEPRRLRFAGARAPSLVVREGGGRGSRAVPARRRPSFSATSLALHPRDRRRVPSAPPERSEERRVGKEC